MRVLLMGEYRLLLKALKRGLEEDGFTVDVAASDFDGEGVIPPAEYHVIVLDLFRPDGPNLALVRRWRQAGLKSSVLVLTGISEKDQPAREQDMGVDDVLTKPFPLDEFLDRVRELVYHP
jgi:DNA-binding response OmpR family regulator